MQYFTTLRDANTARQKLWDTKGVLDAAYRGNELAGETGEACNIIKKLERERHGIGGTRSNPAALAEELADVVICCDLIALYYGFDLGAAVQLKFNLSSDRLMLPVKLSGYRELM